MILTVNFLAGFVFALGLVWLGQRLFSFRAQRPEDYAGLSPAFDLRRHLAGPMSCEGVIYGPAGRVAARFTARMQGVWQGEEGRLNERFLYDSGTSQSRAWTLRLSGDGRIEAEAPDVIGTGRGWQSGPAVCLCYRIRLPEASGGHVLSVIDWMYLTENGTIINRSQFRKFGVKVAELVATMRPEDDSNRRAEAA